MEGRDVPATGSSLTGARPRRVRAAVGAGALLHDGVDGGRPGQQFTAFRQAAGSPRKRVDHLPIACELSDAELRARGADLLPGLVRRATARVPLPDGYRWVFTPTEGLLAEVARVVDTERRCCRFLRFSVEIEADGGPVSLRVTGPPGTVQFLDQLPARTAT